MSAYGIAGAHSETCAWRFGMNAKCDCRLADVDRAAPAPHPWEQSRAEENDALWHVGYGEREDW